MKGELMNIAILTNFQDFHPGYSLTGIVQDQITMLTRHGHNVHLFVSTNYNAKHDPPEWEATLHKVVPFGHLVDYQSRVAKKPEHDQLSIEVKEMLTKEFEANDIDIAFTHDWIFTGWNLPYGDGVKAYGLLNHRVRWFHWVHSIPSKNSDWWRIKEYGPCHKIVFPNRTDATRVAEQYHGELEDIRVIPHIKDPRSWYDFHPETCRFIDDYPLVMQGDIIQIYPASTDRLATKRIDNLIEIFASIKEKGLRVCLVIANQWATGREAQQPLKPYYDLANKRGLLNGDEFIFTSDWDTEKYGTGIPRRMLAELQLLQNLFIFPTREESFGLVGPEAAINGSFMVLNKNLDMMQEVFGNNGLYMDFGSFHNQLNVPHENYWRDVGTIILGRMYNNESIRTRTFCRKAYNYDALYLHIYEPLLMESSKWGQK